MTTVIAVLLAYLLGSIPTALIMGRLLKGVDIRNEGSGNPGAANTARVIGGLAGLGVGAVDIIKGVLAVLLVARLSPLSGGVAQVLCGAAAVLGHIFPVFAGFRGGKGVATAAGASLVLFPIVAPFCLAALILIAVVSRKVSLASLTAAFILPSAYIVSSLALGTFQWWKASFSVFVFVVMLITHRGNIARLVKGTESTLDLARLFHRGRA